MKKRMVIAIALFIAYLVIGLVFLKDYGINWDEPAHFMRGQSFLRFFLTGKKDYSELPNLDRKNYVFDWGNVFQEPQTEQITRRSIYQYYPREPNSIYAYAEDYQSRGSHPPLSDVIASFFNYLFFQKLGIYPDVHSYNLYPVFLSAVLGAVIYLWVGRIYGLFAGLMAAISLFLYPLFLGERHFNIKDIPQTVFFSLAIMAFFDAMIEKDLKKLVLFSIWGGFALATKYNFGFAVLIIFPWLMILSLNYWFKQGLKKKQMQLFIKENRWFWIYFLAIPIVMGLILILSWPAVWFEPRLLLASIKYHQNIGTSARSTFNTYPLKWALFTIPVVTLFFTILGIISGFFCRFSEKQRKAFWLILFWLIVPIMRVVIPKTVIYGGIRQIMEFIPAVAILSGVGSQSLRNWLFNKLNLKVKNKKIVQVLPPVIKIGFLLSFLPITLKMIQIHPNESVYFNWLVGGLKGAQEKNIPDWGESLGNPYRQGVKWLNRNAEPGAKVALGYELIANIPYLWFRNDLQYDNLVRSGPTRQGEYLISATTGRNPRLDWYQMRYLEKFLEPVYQVKVDNTPILKIWKNDAEHTKKGYLNEEETKGAILKKHDFNLTITLPEPVYVTRLEFISPAESCQHLEGPNGSFRTYGRVESSSLAFLPAIFTDFQGKLNFPKPFCLLAAEEAQKIEYYFEPNSDCFQQVSGVRIYGLKDLKPKG